MLFFAFLFLRIPILDVGFLDTNEKQKVSKKENAWYYVHIFKRLDFDSITRDFGINENYLLPLGPDTFSCLLSHETAEKLSKNKNFWIKKIPSKHKITKSETGYYSTLCSKTCELPGEVITRTDSYAIIKYDGPVEKLAKTTCARLFAPYANNIQLQSRYHRALTHNYTYAMEHDPANEYFSRSRMKMHNYTGEGQCIAVIDSGVDNRSMWFQRESLSVDAKIFTTYPLADDVDDDEGHGTFVAGIAAGKAFCSNYAATYNGVAEDARILVVDIKNRETGQYAFPENLLDLYEPCIQLKCPITLNAWTSDDPLMATALDIIAFNHPMLTMIFPAAKDANGRIISPGNAKNVLSVGSTYGHPGSKAVFSTNTPVTIYNSRTKEYTMGYTDPQGSPLLNSTYTKNGELIGVTAGSEKGQVSMVSEQGEMISHYKGAAAVLVFHEGKLYGKVDFPVIRVPPYKKDRFEDGDVLNVLSMPSIDEGPTSINRLTQENGYFDSKIPFYIKPEIVTPGGPMIGPRSGSSDCGLDGLTVKEGPSVSAAVVAGDCAIIRQYLQNTTLKGVKHVASAAIRGTLAVLSQDLYGHEFKAPFPGSGFGTPQLENLFKNGTHLSVFQNITIESDTRQDYCFQINEEGVLKIAIAWNDYPRDPKSHERLTQPLHLSVATNDNPYVHVLANINERDMPTLDHFNTIQMATIKVRKGNKIRLSVTSGYFAIPKPALYSLTIFGPTVVPTNLSCASYFISGNCPRGCDGRGSSCNHNKLCICGYDRGGDFCTYKADRLHHDGIHDVLFKKRFEWRFFKFHPPNWRPGCSLTVHLDGIDFTKVGFLINAGTLPKWNEYLCTETYCPWAEINEIDQSYTFKYEEWEFINKQHMFTFGFFAKTRSTYNFTVRFKTHSPI